MKTISDHVLDIAQNALEAKATLIDIIVNENKIDDFYMLGIKDNGCGMNEKILQLAENPFFTTRTSRKVGLGIPLLKQNATAAKGTFRLDSDEGKGTSIKAVFQWSHIDRPPTGDIWNTIFLLMAGNPAIHFKYTHTTDKGTFAIDSIELRTLLEGISLQQGDVRIAFIELIKNNLEDIKASK